MANLDPQVEQRLSKLEKHVSALSDFHNRSFWHSADQHYALTLPQRTIECIVCSHRAPHGSFAPVVDECMFGGGRLERYVCPECDCIFGPQKYLDLSDAFVARDYELLYMNYEEGQSLEQEVRTFRSLTPKVGEVVINWGCGASSDTVDALRAEGWDVWGFEPHAQTSSPFVVNHEGMIRPNVDGLFSNNVIEHFRRPVEQLKHLATFLKPGGLMAHSTPCYEYRYAFTRFHNIFLLGRSLQVLALRAGLELISTELDGEYGSALFRKPHNV